MNARPIRIPLDLVRFSSLLVILASCSTTSPEPQPQVRTCNKPLIQKAIQSLYDKSPADIKNIDRLIDAKEFQQPCEGQFKARSPIMGWPSQSRYPEISIGWNLRYSISRASGICIQRENFPASSGTYHSCIK